MKTRAISLILGVSLLCQSLLAQEIEHSIEELYLQSDIETVIIKAEAESSDRDLKMSALKKIASIVEHGSASDNAETMDVLGYLAGESVSNIAREKRHVLNDYPEVRRESVRLLGLIGSDRAVHELERVLSNDSEPIVVAEAILAIASIDIENRALRDRLIAKAVQRQDFFIKDSLFASTFLRSVEMIVQRDGNKISPAILAEVMSIAEAGSGYNQSVRKRASKLIRNLQNLIGISTSP